MPKRVYRKEQWRDDEAELVDMFEKKYPQEYACSQKIAAFISDEYGVHVSREEMMYLAIIYAGYLSKAARMQTQMKE